MKVLVIFSFCLSIILALEAPLLPRTPDKRVEVLNGVVEKGGYGYDNYGYGDESKSDGKSEDKSDSGSDSKKDSDSKSDSSSGSHEHHHPIEASTTQEPVTCPASQRPEEACPIQDRIGEVPLFVANGVVAAQGVVTFFLGVTQKSADYLCDCNEGSLQFFEPFRINDVLKRKKRLIGTLFPKEAFSYGFNSNTCQNICIRDEEGNFWEPSTWHAGGFEDLFLTRNARAANKASAKKSAKKARKSSKKAKVLAAQRQQSVAAATTVVTEATTINVTAPPTAEQQPIQQTITQHPEQPTQQPTTITQNPVSVSDQPISPANVPAQTENPANVPPTPTVQPTVNVQSTTTKAVPEPAHDSEIVAPPPPPAGTQTDAIAQFTPQILSSHVLGLGGLFKFIEGYIIPYCHGSECHQYLLLTPWSSKLVGKDANGKFIGKYSNRCLYESLFDGPTRAGAEPSFSAPEAEASFTQLQSAISIFQDGNSFFDSGSGSGGCKLLKVTAISCHGCGPIKGDSVKECYKQAF